jgi:hypothetical protein
MRTEQKLYLKALDNTLVCLANNTIAVAKLPIATPTISGISASVQTLYGIDTQLQSLNQQNATSKTKQRVALTTSCLEIAAKGRAFAIHTQNDALEQILTTTASILNRLGDTIFRDRAQMIKNTVEAEIANIDATVYHLTAANLTAFQTRIDAYTQAIPGPNSRISQIKTLNANFETLLTDTKALAKKLDALVETVRFSETAFYAAYNAARKPQKAAKNTRALVLNISDANTQTALYRATVNITNQTNQKSISKTSTQKGNIVVQNLPEGTYAIKTTEHGYETHTVTVAIRSGHTTTEYIALTPML